MSQLQVKHVVFLLIYERLIPIYYVMVSVLSRIVSPQKSYVEVLMPGACECDLFLEIGSLQIYSSYDEIILE